MEFNNINFEIKLITVTEAMKRLEKALKITAIKFQRLAKGLKFGRSIPAKILLRLMQLGIMREKVTWLGQKITFVAY